MAKVLVVVDVQNGAVLGGYHGRYLNRKWWRRFASMISNVRHLCTKFRRVIFVTHTGFRKKEFLEIVDELSDHASVALRVFKSEDDGSDVLAPHVSIRDKIYVCGMNTDACVLRTARGLLKRGYWVTVVGDACWSVYAAKSSKSHHDALFRLRSTYDIPTPLTSQI